jgi:hypothetical protein
MTFDLIFNSHEFYLHVSIIKIFTLDMSPYLTSHLHREKVIFRACKVCVDNNHMQRERKGLLCFEEAK